MRLTRPAEWVRDYWPPFDRYRKLDRVRTVHGEITGLDPVARTVAVRRADGTETIEPYDVLVISTGVSNGFWRRPGLESADEVASGIDDAHRRLAEAGTRVVEVIWPKVANSDNHSWDVHSDLSKRMKTQSAPMFDTGLSALITDMDQRGLLEDTLVVAIGEFGRSPQRGLSTSGNQNSNDGRDHWPYCYTACLFGAGVKRDGQSLGCRIDADRLGRGMGGDHLVEILE